MQFFLKKILQQKKKKENFLRKKNWNKQKADEKRTKKTLIFRLSKMQFVFSVLFLIFVYKFNWFNVLFVFVASGVKNQAKKNACNEKRQASEKKPLATKNGKRKGERTKRKQPLTIC